ncbi:uncharacterized protein [Macrobrachium rosenbergii]|uniref:uncharacterized protein n=1 Tax=Macrobrachium rosenbergii TaxID=79674 RepID=UPI0034D4E277
MSLVGYKGESHSLMVADIPDICAPLFCPSVPDEEVMAFSKLQLADDYMNNRHVNVDILVGLNAYWRFMVSNKTVQSKNLVAQESVFGWVLSGSCNIPLDRVSVTSQLLCINNVSEPDLHKFWNLGSVGISSKEAVSSEFSSSAVLQKFSDNVKFIDGRYEVSLPWKSDVAKQSLKNNEKPTHKMMENLNLKFVKIPGLRERYDEAFEEYEKDDITEEVPHSEISSVYPVYCLPHHSVIRESSNSTKVKPVFDASADVWRIGLKWDDVLPEELHCKFQRWLRGFEKLGSWKVQRCYFEDLSWKDLTGLELHSFGDASEKGYGVCVYLRVPLQDGSFKASLIMNRGKVAPIKKVSLPRLELLGAMLSAQLLVFAKSALRFKEDVTSYCWTDSIVALSWIKRDPSRWKPFVANRVMEIQILTSPDCWCHCPGKDNPADLISRGVFAEHLVQIFGWYDSKACSQPVAPLPELRVKSAPPFSVTGLDFAGPLFCQHYGPLAPQWKFTVPRAPWWGGWWERLVRSVKFALKKTLGVKCLSRCELETTLHEVAAYINSRPLTFVGEEVDTCNPLTPSHFLIGRTVGVQPEVVEEHSSCVSSKDLCMRETARQRQLDKFWEIWSSDYIRNLPCAIKGFVSKCNVKKGSVVLVKEDNVRRLSWPLGVIIEVYLGKDGVIRSVDVKTSKGIINRPVQKLHDLEISNVVDTEAKDSVPCIVSEVNDESLPKPVSNNSDVNADDSGHDISQSRVEPISYTRRGHLGKAPVKLE